MGRMQPGISIALLSAVLFGASTPLAKMMLGNVGPWMMAGLLYLGAGLGLTVVHLSRSVLQLPAVEAPLRPVGYAVARRCHRNRRPPGAFISRVRTH